MTAPRPASRLLAPVAGGGPVTLDCVHHCDALTLLRALPSGSVDALIADPPYDMTELDFDGPIDWLTFWEECRRVLVNDNAPTILFSQQPFTTDLICSNREGWRYEIIWEKTMPVGYLDANRRPLRCHENIQVFADAQPPYYPVMEVAPDMRARVRNRVGQSGHYNQHDRITSWSDTGTRYPRSVWVHAQRTNAFKFTHTNHPTEKPLSLMERLIETFTLPGAIIVDCFVGSGSTCVAARNLKRHFIGADKDAACVLSARERLRLPFEPHHVAPNNDLTALPLFASVGVLNV